MLSIKVHLCRTFYIIDVSVSVNDSNCYDFAPDSNTCESVTLSTYIIIETKMNCAESTKIATYINIAPVECEHAQYLNYRAMYSRYKDSLYSVMEADQLDKSLSTKTCLSPLVHSILCTSVETPVTVEATQVIQAVYNEENKMFINLKSFAEIFPAEENDSFEYFLQCAVQMQPLIQTIYQTLHGSSSQQIIEVYNQCYAWTSSPKLIEEAVTILLSATPCSSVHAIMLLTSVLERSLGNVFLMVGSPPCPSMLKDLLVAPEIKDVFGNSAVSILRALIGPPTSLNIRNVLWHGFPLPGEIHSGYGFLLFSLICSLGRELKMNTKFKKIKSRKYVSFSDESVALLNSNLAAPELDASVALSLFQESNFVLSSMLPFWELGMQLYMEGRYGECCAIFLPQLEHGMRRVFAVANNCPERVLTAENTTLFTTFDEILSPTVTDTEANKLYTALEQPYVLLLFDMLRYPDCPRFRDRISHGETDLITISRHTALHVVNVVAAFCCRFLPKHSDLWKEAWICSLNDAASKYTCVFHPSAIVSRQLSTLYNSVSQWKSIAAPEEIECTPWHIYHSCDYKTLIQYQAAEVWAEHGGIEKDALTKLFDITHNIDDIPALLIKSGVYFDYLEKFRNLLHSAHPQKVKDQNEEICRLLQRIGKLSVEASEQVMEQGRTKHQQFVEKMMRSRQRNTYRRMLDSLLPLWCSFQLITLVYCTVMVDLMVTHYGRHEHTKLTKFLKSILQFCENLCQYTSTDKNRWEEARTLSDEMAGKVQTYMQTL